MIVDAAAQQVEEWLDAPRAWLAQPTTGYRDVFVSLVRTHRVTGPLVTDAQLAALAIDHGVPLISTDADFARFDQLTWFNPLASLASRLRGRWSIAVSRSQNCARSPLQTG